MDEDPLTCHYCGISSYPTALLKQCDRCEEWVCQPCGGVRYDEEATGLICLLCLEGLHHVAQAVFQEETDSR